MLISSPAFTNLPLYLFLASAFTFLLWYLIVFVYNRRRFFSRYRSKLSSLVTSSALSPDLRSEACCPLSMLPELRLCCISALCTAFPAEIDPAVVQPETSGRACQCPECATYKLAEVRKEIENIDHETNIYLHTQFSNCWKYRTSWLFFAHPTPRLVETTK